MSESLLDATAERLFASHVTASVLAAAEGGAFPTALWSAVEEAGFTRGLVPEAAGGFGMDAAEAVALLRVAGRHAAPVPLAETMAASWLLAGAGLPIPDGAMSVAPVGMGDSLLLERDGAGWRLSGRASRVPWGRDAGTVVVLAALGAATLVVTVPAAGYTVRTGGNLAREPRDTLDFHAVLADAAVAPAAAGVGRDGLFALGAAMRSLQMAGALARLLAMSTQYALDRKQFGRPLGKFQAIQQSLAQLGAHQAAAGAAADGAAEAAGMLIASGEMRLLPIAVGKLRTGEAAGLGAAIAHQVHGAIGFTYEHSLHFLTKRLWSWRNEFGSESYWGLRLGRELAAGGPDLLWRNITAA